MIAGSTPTSRRVHAYLGSSSPSSRPLPRLNLAHEETSLRLLIELAAFKTLERVAREGCASFKASLRAPRVVCRRRKTLGVARG